MPTTLCLVSVASSTVLPRNPAVAWSLKLARSHIRRSGHTLASAYWATREIQSAPSTHHGRQARAAAAAWRHANRLAQRALAAQRCSPPGGCVLHLAS